MPTKHTPSLSFVGDSHLHQVLCQHRTGTERTLIKGAQSFIVLDRAYVIMSDNLSLSYSKVNQQSNQPPIKTFIGNQINQYSTESMMQMTTTSIPRMDISNIKEETKHQSTNTENMNDEDIKQQYRSI